MMPRSLHPMLRWLMQQEVSLSILAPLTVMCDAALPFLIVVPERGWSPVFRLQTRAIGEVGCSRISGYIRSRRLRRGQRLLIVHLGRKRGSLAACCISGFGAMFLTQFSPFSCRIAIRWTLLFANGTVNSVVISSRKRVSDNCGGEFATRLNQLGSPPEQSFSQYEVVGLALPVLKHAISC